MAATLVREEEDVRVFRVVPGAPRFLHPPECLQPALTPDREGAEEVAGDEVDERLWHRPIEPSRATALREGTSYHEAVPGAQDRWGPDVGQDARQWGMGRQEPFTGAGIVVVAALAPQSERLENRLLACEFPVPTPDVDLPERLAFGVA
jgi:hypothetical protein